MVSREDQAAARARAKAEAAERAEDAYYSTCPVCGKVRRLNGPVGGPGPTPRFLEHARFIKAINPQPEELPEYRTTCGGSLMLVPSAVAPVFASADTGSGT